MTMITRLTRPLSIFLLTIPTICSAQPARLLGEGEQPAFRPDGRVIIFQASDRHIWTMHLDGSGRRQLSTLASECAPRWSPDAGTIVFQSYGKSHASGRFAIWLMDSSGTNHRCPIEPATRSSGDQYPEFSPDGKRIVWTHGKQLWIMDSNGGNPRPLTSPAAKQFECVGGWSPDGRTIVYLAGDDYSEYPNFEIRLIDSSGHNQRSLPTPTRAYQVRWSLSDSCLYYSTGNQLMRVKPDGSRPPEKVLTFFDPPQVDIQEFDLSPDGTCIVWSDPGAERDGEIHLQNFR